ncbi:MAG: 2-C-methyl-D-erythritol 4-phosphate cytidylyltransferase [Cryomorphaceae bacterium]|jgi:2-C-methyl-D-erythritol 4-phosphate cytidylyltransferase|nr:2-C-methyl-D-erythritol 4-phosphate cytidylyltransferase [Cryomorphaceae bacterium]
MQVSVIITAGGIGKRMGGIVPKQFLLLAGKPVLIHTLERFNTLLPDAQFILSLPSDWQAYWKELTTQYNLKVPHVLANGGAERFHSVKNALALATGTTVFVHDAVRPFFSKATIARCQDALNENLAVVPVINVKETLRELIGNQSRTVDRTHFRLVQTPQCFHRDVLVKAYDQDYDPAFTDDASVVERAGAAVVLVEGNEENIKLTTPLDMQLAELFSKIRDL